MEQLANMPLWAQILGWGVFMGLNGYIGAACPGLNLAALAFMGMFANRKVGVVLLIVSILVTLAESFWFVLIGFAVGMSATPQKVPSFITQGTGILNLFLAGIVFFILIGLITASFPFPKWLVVTVVALFYIAGAWAGVTYWIPVVSHGVVLAAVGLLVALCYTASAPFAIGISALLFLALAGVWGATIFHWNQERKTATHQRNVNAEFLEAATNNQPAQIASLWNSADSGTKEKALSNALLAKQADLVTFLVKQGTETEQIMRNAIYKKDLDSIKMLTEAGTVMNPYDAIYATESNFLPAVQFFVEKGVDINHENNNPLSTAVKERYTEIAEYLLKTGKNSQATLNEALVELCASHKYRGHETDKENMAKRLLEYGAQANNHAGYFNKTPLHGAGYGPLALVKLLVEKGADVNATDEDGTSVLMEAVKQDNVEIARFLLQQGAKQTINAVYHSTNSSLTGYTALFMAKSAPMAQLLLENGADVTSTDSRGATVLSNAIRKDVSLIKLLLESGVDINRQDRKGKTALFDAVIADKLEVLQLLLAHGADVNLTNNEGKTPLLIADKLEVLQLLLAHGAHVNAKDKDGKTALIKIAQRYDEDGAKVKLLLDHGADVNARDNNGNTALTYASSRTSKHSWYSEKQIEVLKQHGAKK